MAYSPGVAEPCVAIQSNERWAYEYTAKGHLVGVVTNGTAVLGLGNIGPLAGGWWGRDWFAGRRGAESLPRGVLACIPEDACAGTQVMCSSSGLQACTPLGRGCCQSMGACVTWNESRGPHNTHARDTQSHASLTSTSACLNLLPRAGLYLALCIGTWWGLCWAQP